MSDYPNISAIASGTISGNFRDWPKVRPEAKALLDRVKELENSTDLRKVMDELADARVTEAQLVKRVEELERARAGWEADALREHQNAAFHRERAEAAEAKLARLVEAGGYLHEACRFYENDATRVQQERWEDALAAAKGGVHAIDCDMGKDCTCVQEKGER